MHPTGLGPGTPPTRRFGSPEAYTPKHLAEEILTSRASLEGERKQVTVLFVDVVGSTALFEQLDPEIEGMMRSIRDPELHASLLAAPGAKEAFNLGAPG